MLVIDVNSRLNRRSREEGRELPLTSAWRQFPALLSASAVELRVLSRNTGKQRFKMRSIVGIYKQLPDIRMQKLGTRLRCFISGKICLDFRYSAVRHVTGNDKDYLRKIPRGVWQTTALDKGPLQVNCQPMLPVKLEV